jgi:hypothetical protein
MLSEQFHHPGVREQNKAPFALLATYNDVDTHCIECGHHPIFANAALIRNLKILS